MQPKFIKLCKVLTIVLVMTFISLILIGCKKKDSGDNGMILSLSNSKAEIGVTENQKWVFNKKNDTWLFDGVYAFSNDVFVKVFIGTDGKLNENDELNKNGAYFTVQASNELDSFSNFVGNFVEHIEVVDDEDNTKSLKLTGKGFTSYLKVEADGAFVERSFVFDFDQDVTITEGEVSFTLKTDISSHNEYGFILGHANEVTQYSLPYAFPAVLSKLTSRQGEDVISYVDVVDYYETSPGFKTARRKEHLNGFMELGIISSATTLSKDFEHKLVEKIYVSGDTSSYYDLIYQARKTYATFYELPLEEIHQVNGNMTVSSWIDAAVGVVGDITDSRSRPVGDHSTFGPYGYNNGSSEAFGAMDILKGLTRYAMAIGDAELYEDCMNYLTVFISKDSSGKGYIMPLSKYKSIYSDADVYFFRSQGSDGNFNPLDPSFTDTADVFGSFKYYSRVINLGELALITEREDLKQAYLSLMPFILKMKGPNYEQDIQWNFNGTPSNYEYDNGGSMGAEAMWANVMYIASLIETSEQKKADYLLHAEKSLEQANKQDFPKSSALRQYPKPESLTYSAKMNLIFFELKNEQKYLDEALEVVGAVHFYYFASTHPNTYYQTLGYGYADARERWEAFMEMVETLVLGTNILKYTDDPLLLDLFYTLEKSALWTLPINGYPDGYLGGHSDWLDALYVPFEQPTAHMGDNTVHDGGGMSYLRHSKELYGAGEIFTGALTFEVFAKAYSPYVTMINLGGAIDTKLDRTHQTFAAWNISKEKVSTPVFFDNYEEGNYEIIVDEQALGVYTHEQLKNGVLLEFNSREKHMVEVTKTTKTPVSLPLSGSITAEVVKNESNQTEIKVNGNASFYRVTTSYSEDFNETRSTTHIFTENQFTLYHEDSMSFYIRITPSTSAGVTGDSVVLHIESTDVEIGYLEDFNYSNKNGVEPISSWTADSLYYQGNPRLISDSNGFKNYPEGYKAPTGYMAVYKPDYSGFDKDTFTHEANVDITKYPLFDFYPYTKNMGSTFTLKLQVGSSVYTLLDKVSSFDQVVYRYDLSKIAQETGENTVKITFEVEGFNRGFAISQLRFVNELDAYQDYELSDDSFESDATFDQNGNLVITHQNVIQNVATYQVGKINLHDYNKINLVLSGVLIEHNRTVYVNVDVYQDDQMIPVITYRELLDFKGNVEIDISNLQLDDTEHHYTIKTSFTKRIGGQYVPEIFVKSMMLESDHVIQRNDVYIAENGGYKLNKWSSNWAYISSEGFIYNGNPNVAYGSIFIKNVAVNLDETPIVRFYVSEVIPGTQFTLKVNDNNTFGTDLALNTQTGEPGIYSINLRDKVNRGGVIVLQFDFYVIGSGNTGAKFEYIEFVEGKTIYENSLGYTYSTLTSNEISVDTNKTPYLFVDVEHITYGDEWKLYLEYQGIRYEVKTVYETVYGQMYTRSKYGAFKYDLRDILPNNNTGLYDVKLIVQIGGEDGATVQFRSIRLANNNEVPLINRITFVNYK